jgi:hypothetical protein
MKQTTIEILQQLLAQRLGEAIEIRLSSSTWGQIAAEANALSNDGQAPAGDTFMGVPVRLDESQGGKISIDWRSGPRLGTSSCSWA